jgi:hypothetical protein
MEGVEAERFSAVVAGLTVSGSFAALRMTALSFVDAAGFVGAVASGVAA